MLDGPEGRHAATVRRLRAGEELVLSDGSGSAGAVLASPRSSGTPLALRVVERWVEPAPTPRVVLAQALVKGDRGELAVELATEAGVDGVRAVARRPLRRQVGGRPARRESAGALALHRSRSGEAGPARAGACRRRTGQHHAVV